ncbi:MAG TPA: NAD-dependent epimerase [Candidatus Omnitrophica bacterium]|nr:MAG: NAD-dependent epimerase [Omnitrophica WOR_2 bacterium RIFCSPLOWO2_12_FULL_63_16]HBQ38700.1 NAD-dependent epimerase [Candidatus Omnitrophota bacterium]
MKVVVCGGSGFLGSHVADALTERGYDVTIFDRQPSAHATPTQRMVVGDILDGEAAAQVFQGCDYVYHFAGLADLDDAAVTSVETVEQNVRGTVILLEAARNAGVKRFVYASTVYVYSHLGGFYRCSKQAGELYVEEYHRRYGLDYTILRHGTLYGPRASQQNSLQRYLRQGLVEGRIAFTGSKEDVREYLHVRDAARLSVEILSEGFRNQHIIITGHHPMKAVDLLSMIREILHRDVTITFTNTPNAAHYVVTPYSFSPKVGNKLVSNCYIDMGQGLLECLHEIYARLPSDQRHERVIVTSGGAA